MFWSMMERFKLLINQYFNQLMNTIGEYQFVRQTTSTSTLSQINGGIVFLFGANLSIELIKILYRSLNEYFKYFLHFTSGLFWNTYFHFVLPLFFYVLLLIQTQIPATISMWIIGKNESRSNS